MAQTMLLMSSQAVSLKRDHPLLHFQAQGLKPKPVSHLFFNPLSNGVHTSPKAFTTLAIFKSKTKAAPKRVEPKPKVEDGIFGTSGGIGFTKQNELFVGRVAMLGFAASLLGEAITGKGILAQLNLETGIPIYEAEPLLLFFILFTLLGAIGALGDRGRFVDDPPTGIEGAVIPPGKGIRGALGLKEGGKGALAQLNIETGIPISDIEPLVLFNVAFFFFAAINPGTGKFLTDEEEE
uniref:Photosystem II 22 kDa protein, chloroplastic n=1 Tax=Gossypium raimondii TaxID=29730 RepID=A0A0D2S7J9_GOSRA|nr:hypothetical protein B456_009G245800 [Gossypium raimondii]